MVYRKYLSPELSLQKIETEMALHQNGSLPISLERQYRAVSKSPHCYSVIVFFQLEENKHNPKCIFDTVAKLTKKQHSPREDGFHFSSDKFMNFFDEKIMIIRKQITDSSKVAEIKPLLKNPKLDPENSIGLYRITREGGKSPFNGVRPRLCICPRAPRP
jgi:hypothetical protein